MKKQNENDKMAFNKIAVVELNDSLLYRIQGGDLTDAATAISNVVVELMHEANAAGYAISYAVTTKVR